MTKLEYMDCLNEALKDFDSEIRDEIIADYDEHFKVGSANGKSDEQVIEELGSVEQLISELNSFSDDKKEKSFKDKANDFIKSGADFFSGNDEASKSFDDVMKSVAGFLGSMAANITNGTEKFTVDFSDKSKDFADTAESFAKDFAAGFESATDKVVSKSTSFAKEVANSYKSARKPSEQPNDEAVDAESIEASTESSSEEKIAPEKVYIETDCGDVIVSRSSDEEVHFEYTNNGSANQQLAYKFAFKQEGSSVFATAKKQLTVSNFFSNMSTPEIILTVEIPESVKFLGIHTVSGDVSFKDMELANLNVATASGDVELSNIKTVDTIVSSISGDLQLENFESTSANLKTVSGDVSLRGNFPIGKLSTASGDMEIILDKAKELNISSVSGDVNARLLNLAGYNATVKSVSGEINLAYGDNNRSALSSGNYFFGEGDVQVNVATTSGDIKVIA